MGRTNEQEIQQYKYSNYRVRKTEWLWYPYIPVGKITLLTGEPGDGKSLFILNLIALLTAGKKLPDKSKARKPINAIYQSVEDNPEDTIKPRLLKAGADCDRVYCFRKETGLFLNDQNLENAVSESKAKLVVFDPIQSFLPDNVDMMNAGNMRNIMNHLTEIAENCKCAIVLICHLNKGNGGKNLYRMLGSIDIAAAARSILMINRDDSDAELRTISQIKNNLAPVGTDIVFRLSKKNGFIWEMPHEKNDASAGSPINRAKEILLQRLENGEVKTKDMLDQMCAAGISKCTTRRAMLELRIKSFKSGKAWYWKLPESSEEKENGKND